MYLGVDIGGSKTLVAVFDVNGVITEQSKFPTPQEYPDFLKALEQALASLQTQEFQAATVAVPGQLDREHGVVLRLGNLPWQHEAIQADCERVTNCPVLIENDAKLAGLSEAMLHKDAETVLYVTVSTGIGTSVVYQQHLDRATQDSEGGHIMLPFHGKLTKWESFASGKAIYEHFGKKASDIPASDTRTWRYIAHNLALGLYELIAILEPNLVVIGGSIGTYFDRYGDILNELVQQFATPLVSMPRIVGAERAEEAVVYGCYDLIMQELPHHAAARR